MKARGGPLVALLFAAPLVVPCTGVADERGLFQGKVAPVVVSPSTEPETYGLVHHTALMMGSFLFEGLSSNTTTDWGNGIERYVTSGEGVVAHPVIPNGALIEYIQLRACDTDVTDSVSVDLFACPTQGTGCVAVASMTTSDPATPGCEEFLHQLAIPLQVDNQYPITVLVQTGTTSATTFSGVKLYYRLQVSPAPSVATFSDVPTSYWAFQFIEALAFSGITVGVTPTTFEPESPVTRAQMAVFLAKALGLHWPN